MINKNYQNISVYQHVGTDQLQNKFLSITIHDQGYTHQCWAFSLATMIRHSREGKRNDRTYKNKILSTNQQILKGDTYICSFLAFSLNIEQLPKT